jgi:hypothetical protein
VQLLIWLDLFEQKMPDYKHVFNGITNQLLCQLSYAGVIWKFIMIRGKTSKIKTRIFNLGAFWEW